MNDRPEVPLLHLTSVVGSSTARSGAQDIAIALIVRFVEGVDDPAAIALLRAALLRLIRDGGDLLAHLHLPTTPRRLRLAIRDHWLRDAARIIEAPSTWERAKQLRESALRFTERKWPRWHKRGAPPWDEMPSPVDVALYYARRAAGEPFPRTVEQYANVLEQERETKEIDSRAHFVKGAA